MNVKSITDRFLDPDDYELLGHSVCTGYHACYEVIKTNTALGRFLPGARQWSWLIRTYVEYAILQAEIPGLFEAVKPYAGKNGLFVEFNKRGLRMTAHFMGGGKSKRKQMRQAIYRAHLAKLNGDLFQNEEEQLDVGVGFGHCLIQHAGYSKVPEAVLLAIPDRNQVVSLPPYPLPIIEPKAVEVEQIVDDIRLGLVGAATDGRRKENQ